MTSHVKENEKSIFIFQDRGNAQSSCAGLFINANLGFDYPGIWLHIDMASPAQNVSLYIHYTDRVNIMNPKYYIILKSPNF